MTLTTDVNVTLNWRDIGTDAAGREIVDANAITLALALANGFGLNEADLLFYERATLLAAGSRTYDLAGGESNTRGETLVYARVKAIVLVNLTTTAGNSLSLGGGTEPLAGWLTLSSTSVVVGPGGVFVLANPSADGYVTAAANDRLRVQSTGTNTYDIAILGSAT